MQGESLAPMGAGWGSDVFPSCVMGSSIPTERQHLVYAAHMLPSAGWTASASVTLTISWLNSPPRTIAVYASPPPSPTDTQHSLPGRRYPLPGPDFHRLELASFLAHPSMSLLNCSQ
jgi:hypothetical protein